ncbi:MAG: hypothetical protein WCE75_17250, partial [Terracidiphilus sp.]
PFGGWGAAEEPAAGGLDLLLSLGYSVDLLPDWQLEEASSYPFLLLPDWQDVGPEAVSALVRYVEGGGSLLLCGAENVQLFAGPLGLHAAGPAAEQTLYLADENGFAQVPGSWLRLENSSGETLSSAYPAPDARKDAWPLALRIARGKGSAVVCPGPLISTFGLAGSPTLRSQIAKLASGLAAPAFQAEGEQPGLEIVLRTKDGSTLLHLINTAGQPVTGQFRHTGVVPPIAPLRFRLRLPAAPRVVFLEPEGTRLEGEYRDGHWHSQIPALHVHAAVRFEF